MIYENGHPVLRVECGTTLEVMKLLYESEHKKKGDILGVRPRNSSEIPCIITLHESKLEESAYDVIIKGDFDNIPDLGPQKLFRK